MGKLGENSRSPQNARYIYSLMAVERQKGFLRWGLYTVYRTKEARGQVGTSRRACTVLCHLSCYIMMYLQNMGRESLNTPSWLICSLCTAPPPAPRPQGLLQWLSGKEFTCNAGDAGLILGSEGAPGGGNGNPLQYSSLRNPMDRGTWRATVQRVAESDTTEQLDKHICNV